MLLILVYHFIYACCSLTLEASDRYLYACLLRSILSDNGDRSALLRGDLLITNWHYGRLLHLAGSMLNNFGGPSNTVDAGRRS